MNTGAQGLFWKAFRGMAAGAAVALAGLNAQAQEIPISNTTLTTCGGFLVDTGLSAGDYGPNQNITMTVCPEAPETIITLYFALAALGTGDVLEIHDGPTVGAPLIGSFELFEAQGQEFFASLANPGGCLTLHFTSDATGNGSFGAEMSCGYPCQRPFAIVQTEESVPLHVCPGEEIVFDATGSTVAEGFEIVTWEWTFDDGATASGQPVVTHSFAEPGAYKVQLSIADNNITEDDPEGCQNNNLVDHLVLVSTEPDWTGISGDATICSGQIYPLTGAVTGVTYDDTPSANFGGALFIPDDQSQCFSSGLTFTAFAPGATVGNANVDIVNMFMNFEHSYMGDLVISLICPDGSSMALHQQNGGGTFLGEPVDVDGTPDIAGVGYDYWFSPTSNNGTWAENAGAGGTLPSGTYEATQSWSLLNGCPLNGTWEIEICDMWGSDNGFIFDWTIQFNSNLYPDPIVFTPVFGMGCDSTFWQGPSILNQSANCNNINIQPPTPGVETYTFVATNDFGCTYTHEVDITVVQGPIIQIAEPTDYCGQQVALSGVVTNVTPGYVYNYSWSPGNLLNNPNSPNTTLNSLDQETSFALTVQVIGGSLQNCSATQNVVVGVLEPPVSAPLQSYDICLGEVLALVAPEQPGGWDQFLYNWSHTYACDVPETPVVEICTDPLGNQPGQEATEAGSYTVVVSMPAPCVWTASADYEVFTEVCELIIPNVFSPNNDTKNDAFYVDGLDAYPRSTMRIYNRWGGLVFSSDDFGNSSGWRPADGEASEGTYYYVLGVARNTSELIVVDIDGLNTYGGQGMKYFSGSFSLVR